MSAIKCPTCPATILVDCFLEPYLPAKSCPRCDGVWLPSPDYWAWLQRQEVAAESPAVDKDGAKSVDADAQPAQRCPDCGHFLSHAKVGHGVTFQIDRCGTCGGMWFNKGEWDALRARNLHTQAHFIFSPAWQSAIACDQRREAHEAILLQKLGSADLDEIRRIKKWVEMHPHRAELHAYLQPHEPGGSPAGSPEAPRAAAFSVKSVPA